MNNIIFLSLLLIFNTANTVNKITSNKIKTPSSNLEISLMNSKTYGNPTISHITKRFIMDKNNNSCSVVIQEEVQFQFAKPTDISNYIIISKSNIYGLKVTLPVDYNSSLSISSVKFFNEKNLKENYKQKTCSFEVNQFFLLHFFHLKLLQ